jgi:hypothetical protein
MVKRKLAPPTPATRVEASLQTLCLEEVVNVVYTLQHQEAVTPELETVEAKVQAIMSLLPHTMLGAFMMLYQARCHRPQTMLQTALDLVLYAPVLEDELNVCRNCGNHEALDFELVHEHLVHALTQAKVWYIPPSVFVAVSDGLDFDPSYSCRMTDFQRWYTTTMGVHRFAYSSTDYLQAHQCGYRYLKGTIQGVQLRTGQRPSVPLETASLLHTV